MCRRSHRRGSPVACSSQPAAVAGGCRGQRCCSGGAGRSSSGAAAETAPAVGCAAGGEAAGIVAAADAAALVGCPSAAATPPPSSPPAPLLLLSLLLLWLASEGAAGRRQLPTLLPSHCQGARSCATTPCPCPPASCRRAPPGSSAGTAVCCWRCEPCRCCGPCCCILSNCTSASNRASRCCSSSLPSAAAASAAPPAAACAAPSAAAGASPACGPACCLWRITASNFELSRARFCGRSGSESKFMHVAAELGGRRRQGGMQLLQTCLLPLTQLRCTPPIGSHLGLLPCLQLAHVVPRPVDQQQRGCRREGGGTRVQTACRLAGPAGCHAGKKATRNAVLPVGTECS